MSKSKPVTDTQFLAFMKALYEYNVDYILVGGQSLQAHGFTRATEDIDILCMDDGINGAKKLLSALSKIPDSGITDNQDPMCVAHDPNEIHDVIRVNGEYTVDIMYRCSNKTYDDLIHNSVMISMPNQVNIRCASLEQILDMKKGSERLKDKIDCQSILNAMKNLYDEQGFRL